MKALVYQGPGKKSWKRSSQSGYPTAHRRDRENDRDHYLAGTDAYTY